jgi:hypothetical protein
MRIRPFLLVIALFAVAPAGARASRLHVLVPAVTAFTGDGTRWVAFEEPGVKGIHVLDTDAGHGATFASPCVLEDKAAAAAGRFLLDCGSEGEEQALLDARSGATTRLPGRTYRWYGVGARYAIGLTRGRCMGLRREEGCLALYDIANGTVDKVAPSIVPDPNRPGAPPVCRGLRHRVSADSAKEVDEGLGPLSPLESDYSYRDGMLVNAEGLGTEEGEPSPVRHLVLIWCDGARRLIATHPDPSDIEVYGFDLVLGARLLSWDTGHGSEDYEQEEVTGPGHGNLRHGVLVSYDLRTGARQVWQLPVLKLRVLRELVEPAELDVRGTFGISTHTAKDIFWLATRRLPCSYGKAGCSVNGPVISSLYVARVSLG